MSAITMPAVPALKAIAMLAGEHNGRLAPAMLSGIGVRGFKMVTPAARCRKAMQASAVLDGVPLSSTGTYRTFDRQLEGLHERYDKGYILGRKDYNHFDGTWWSLKPGMDQLATPGSSLHGLGRSDDLARETGGRVVDLIDDDVRWLALNAPRFGFFAEVHSERWHWTQHCGDDIPQEVLDFERGTLTGGAGVVVFDPARFHFWLWPLNKDKPLIYYDEKDHMVCDAVAYYQGVLNKNGFPVDVDGDFGSKTHDFTLWFQGQKNLQQDGRVGPDTWAKIDEIA